MKWKMDLAAPPRGDRPGSRTPVLLRALAALVMLVGALTSIDCNDYGDPASPGAPVATLEIVAPASSSVTVDDTIEFEARARDASGDILADAPVTWSSSDPSRASVDDFGRATGVAPGTTSIRAASGGIQSAAVLLTVLPRVTTVVITAPADSTPEIEVGNFVQFTAEARDAGGVAIPAATLAWSSSDTVVARVDATGRAVGRAVGSCNIRVESAGKLSRPVLLTVQPATQVPGTITIVSPASPADVVAGGTLQFTAEVRDTGGDPIPGAAVTWESSNPAAAMIDANGLAHGVAPGGTDITASVDTLRSSPVQLQVTPQPIASVTITSTTNLGVTIGGTYPFTAEARNGAGEIVPGVVFTWTSESEAVASIDASGTARGQSPGTTNIRAESSGLQSPPVVLTVAPPYPFVQQIFDSRCVGCHGTFPEGSLRLSSNVSYSQLVNVPARGRPQFLRVEPFDPANSYLYIKVADCPGPNCSGLRMPEREAPLTASQIETIRLWIAAGAPP